MNNITGKSFFHRRFMLLISLAVLMLASTVNSVAQTVATAPEQAVNSAPVVIDGEPVVKLRGVSSYPAEVRAANVRERILEVAKDDSFAVKNITVTHLDDRSDILAGDRRLISVLDVDAEIENIDRELLAEVIKGKIVEVINRFRIDRSPKILLTHAAYALALTAILAALLWVTLRLFRRLHKWAVRHVHKSVEDLASKSHQLIRANQVWTLVAGLLSTIRALAVLILGYIYLNTVLGLFPWTRAASLILFDLILNPLSSLWNGFVEALPDLMFLIVLFLVVRYILKLTRMFFNMVARGQVKFEGFDADWALPTHRIARFLIIAFSIVVAYPYIPGSDSLAFKGVSVFIGVIFSLGSSSFISNVLAGLAMTYRGAFKIGDRVKIGDVTGIVKEVKLMTTRVNTVKNESIVIPNSNILNTDVVNYSVMARESGLVLHTTVGIGYDTAWRQVEAMLLIAAERTEGLVKDPAPFVLQTSMGDYAVNYEINAYCTDIGRLLAIKSDLHRNIQDVFNEHGVQIMSPAYVNDPQEPKLVRPENWFAEPASEPEK